jgi:hypothetical protein
MALTNAGPGKLSTFIAVPLSAAALLCAAPASADGTDDAFLAALATNGISIPDTTAIQMARNMCALLDQRTTRPLLLMRLMKDTNLSARQAGFFLGVSTAAYCPQYTSVAGNPGS